MKISVSKVSSLQIGVSRADLLADLRKVGWARPEALRQAGNVIARRLGKAWASCEVRARALAHPSDRFVRNVIAEAPADALPFWRLVLLARVLRHGETKFQLLCDALPPSPAEWLLAETLLVGNDEPTEEQFSAFFGPEDVGVSAGLLESAFRKARPGFPAPATVLRLALGSVQERDVFQRTLSRERIRLLDRVFAAMPPTTPVTVADLLALSAAVRRSLVWREGLLSRLGGRALVAAVRRNPALRKEAALGLQKTGLEALRQRRFLDRALTELADRHPASIRIDKELLGRALREGTRRRNPAPEVVDRLARLVRLSPARLRPGLAVLLTRKERRVALLAEIRPAQAASAVSVLPAGDLPFEINVARFLKEGSVHELHWVRYATAEAVKTELVRLPFVVAAGGLERAVLSRDLNSVASSVMADPECRKALATKAGPAGKRVLEAFVRMIRRDPGLAHRELGALLREIPAWGLLAITPSLPDQDVLDLLTVTGLGHDVRRAVIGRALRGKDSDARLGRLLTICSEEDRDVSRLLIDEAVRSRARLLRLLPGHLELLLGPAVERLPLRDLLPVALERLPIARALEKKYSRAQLRAEIHWVRRKFRETPYLAAAYELALAIGLTRAGQLRGLAAKAAAAAGGPRGTALDDLYRCYELPKKSGGNRTVTVPADALKALQRRILRFGFAEIPLHDAATGFRPGLSIRDNALPHVGKPLVVNVDIASFFPSTRYELVLRACRKLLGGKISPAAARLAADLCCFRGALPTGAPTSPAIANIVLTPLDKALGKVCARHGISYTRYADDLTFSGGSDAKKVLPFVHRLLDQLGYRLDGKKTNLFRRGRRQVVTGLVVNDKPNLPRRLRRKLRAAVDQRARGGQAKWHGKFIGDAKLLGLIAHLNLVQPEEARRHKQRLEAARTKKALS